MKLLHTYGFSDSETEEVLLMMHPDRLYRLGLTYAVSMLHALFAFLAFKNDIGYVRKCVFFVSRLLVIIRACNITINIEIAL
jgi:hypothetical protein